jgi:hypothetical protein
MKGKHQRNLCALVAGAGAKTRACRGTPSTIQFMTVWAGNAAAEKVNSSRILQARFTKTPLE